MSDNILPVTQACNNTNPVKSVYVLELIVWKWQTLALTQCAAAEWVADIMSDIAVASLKWRTSYQVKTGQTSDISGMLVLLFWDRIKGYQYSSSGGSQPMSRKKFCPE